MKVGRGRNRKLLYLAQIFMRETDENHPLTARKIIGFLADYGIHTERRTLYQDLEELRLCGFDIIGRNDGRCRVYFLGSRTFELPELKLLVDSVQSAKFISEKKSADLIRRLETLTSRHEAGQLHRQVVIAGRVKTMNESIYYNVDRLHTAISSDRQIRFQYFQWNSKKEMVLRRGGAWYVTSPWILMQDNENYYLVAYDKKHDDIIHFRVDKMLRISLTKDRREGQERFQHFDVPRYARSIFGMFGGEERLVTMEADRDMAGVLIDRFGRGIPIFPAGDPARIRTCVHVDVSPQFLGWIAGLYGRVRITGPDCVVRMMREMIEILRSDYT